MSKKLSVSVIIPVYNEEGNVQRLHQELAAVLGKLGRETEILFVDDGSTDNTLARLKGLRPCRVIALARNYGKSAALYAGFQRARGEIFVVMDGDLQNDPADIPRLLEKIDAGFEVAAGWRQERWQEKKLTRRLPSIAANWFISKLSGVKLHDHGCALKAYRREFLKDIQLQDDMQRMLAVRAAQAGARVVEIPINYRQRQSGREKFGSSRIFKVGLDLIALFFFDRYAKRPLHFFGGAGLVMWFLSVLVFIWALILKIFYATNFTRTPLLLLSAVSVLIGFQFILLGLLSELVLRTRNSQGKSYSIKEELEAK